MKPLTPVNLADAMERSIAFFRKHPEKWISGSMSSRNCHCMAGQMAIELGSTRPSDDGWDVNDKITTIRVDNNLPFRSILSINDRTGTAMDHAKRVAYVMKTFEEAVLPELRKL